MIFCAEQRKFSYKKMSKKVHAAGIFQPHTDSICRAYGAVHDLIFFLAAQIIQAHSVAYKCDKTIVILTKDRLFRIRIK